MRLFGYKEDPFVFLTEDDPVFTTIQWVALDALKLQKWSFSVLSGVAKQFFSCFFSPGLSMICRPTSPNSTFWPGPTRARRDTCTWFPKSSAMCCLITASAWRCVCVCVFVLGQRIRWSHTFKALALVMMMMMMKHFLAWESDKNRGNKPRINCFLETAHPVLIKLHKLHYVC